METRDMGYIQYIWLDSILNLTIKSLTRDFATSATDSYGSLFIIYVS